MEKSNKKNSIVNFDSLPAGYMVLSDKGGVLELTEQEKKDYAIVSINSVEKGMCWFLNTREGLGGNTYFNIKKKIKDLKIEIIKEAEVDPATILKIYEVNKQDQGQKATKEDSAAIAFFELILRDAVNMDVSDIHIHCRPTGGVIKMRKHGELMQWKDRISYTDTVALCSAAYNVLAENKQVSFDAGEYQPAAIPYKIDNNQVKLRYQSMPVYPDGFDVVLRVLPIGRDESFTPLHILGYTEQQVRDLLEAASKPLGAMIIAGVTGSGKSTTLKNLLMFINDSTEHKLKIYTIEDPPEYKIPYISQIPVVRAKGGEEDGRSPFEAPITACMRADPDIIMIGEVRDDKTGILTKKAVQSGHQVLTTVHAPSAIGIIDRFIDFSITRSVLASPDFLTALVYQKLLPTLCPHCKISFNSLIESDNVDSKYLEMADRLGKIKVDTNKYDLFVRNDSGCEHCDNMGISGRQVCAEIIRIDFDLMEKINSGDNVGLIKTWRGRSDKKLDSTNMDGKTCMEHAVQKMLTGIISPFDVEKSFDILTNLYLLDDKEVKKEESDENSFFNNI